MNKIDEIQRLLVKMKQFSKNIDEMHKIGSQPSKTVYKT